MVRRARFRFRVRAWTDWSSESLTCDETYDTEAVARAVARDLTEPLVDLIDSAHGMVIGHRRALAFPGTEARFEAKDTLGGGPTKPLDSPGDPE